MRNTERPKTPGVFCSNIVGMCCVCCWIFLTACGGSQQVSSSDETLTAVEQLENDARWWEPYDREPIRFEVVAGGWSQALPSAPSIEPGFLALTPAEVSNWNLEGFADYPLSRQAQCVARMQWAYFGLFGRLIPFPFESMVHYSCGNAVPRVTYERIFLCEHEEFSGWPGLTDAETMQQDRDQLTGALEWDYEDVEHEFSRREFARQYCERLATDHAYTRTLDPDTWFRPWGTTEEPWLYYRDESRIGSLPSYRETAADTSSNPLWATVAQYQESMIEDVEPGRSWFSGRHFGFACLSAVNGVIECIQVTMYMPDGFILDPVRPQGIPGDEGFWLHGWTRNELTSATMAGIGVQAGACRVRQIDNTGEFFIGCPAPTDGQIGVLHLTCDRGVVDQACLSVRVSRGDTTSAWRHPLLEHNASIPVGSTRTYGSLDYSTELAELLADAREQNGLPRPEVLYTQIEAMNQWAMARVPTATAEAFGTLSAAVEQGHAAGWPVGLSRASVHDTRLATPGSMAVEILQSAAAAGLYESWVDGIAVMLVPCMVLRTGCGSDAYGVMVAVYQRISDPDEAEERVLMAWQHARTRIGLTVPSRSAPWMGARFALFARRLRRGSSPSRAYRAMMDLPSRVEMCGFRIALQNGDFGEWAMLIRDEIWVRPVVYENSTSGVWEVQIVGQMQGRCPQL